MVDMNKTELIEKAILDAVMAVDVPPTARETAMPLVESYIERWAGQDSGEITLGVEVPFTLLVGGNTLYLGFLDHLFQTDNLPLGIGEFKSIREPSRWFKERIWVVEKLRAPQTLLYALAGFHGDLFYGGGWHSGSGRSPAVRFRGVSKGKNHECWPEKELLYRPNSEQLTNIYRALTAKGETISALKNRVGGAITPWQLPGYQCTQYNKLCEFYEKFCQKLNPPQGWGTIKKSRAECKPLTERIEYYKELCKGELSVILSKGLYDTASNCLEKYRIISFKHGEIQSNLNMQIGIAFHAGVGGYHGALM